MSNILPSVLIDGPTWHKICTEASYWADLEKGRGKGPLESVFYPLAAIKVRKESILTPFDQIELSDVDHFIVGDVFLPPREFAHYTGFSAQFRANGKGEAEMQQVFEKGVSAINTRFPQLLFLGPGHTHPFSIESTYPSSTDIEHHIRPYRMKNEELLGFRFSLAIILAKDRSRRGWKACSFAMDAEGYIRDLGPAKVLPGFHSKINCVRINPYYRTRRGKDWEWIQRSELRERLIEHERWPGGWTSFLIKKDEETATLFMIPPRFPTQPPLKQQISLVTRKAGAVEKLDLGIAYDRYKLGGINGDYPGDR